jgi:hypothetical protein
MSLKPKVALSQDFLLQLPTLPSNVQAKIMKWAFLFQTDPKSPSINYEKIHAAVESNLHNVNAKSIYYIKFKFVGKLIPFKVSRDEVGLKLNDYTCPIF